jgi:hypothetical protein
LIGLAVLSPITQDEQLSLHGLSTPLAVADSFDAYVLSTPETRRLCSDPFVVGYEFRLSLQSAITKALRLPALAKIYANAHDEQLNVVHLLRGGLNFPILPALGELGRGCARSSFMSSQRFKKQGTWIIDDDQYLKLTLADDSILLIGDIVATGTTLKVMLAKFAQIYGGLDETSLPDFAKEYVIRSPAEECIPKRIAGMIVFTIGGEEAVRTLNDYHELFRKIFPGYGTTTLVFIEGMFHMANSDTVARNTIDGTDLLPWRADLSPEFEQRLREVPQAGMERCVVYDGGSRGFYPSHHYADLLEYAGQVEESLAAGASLFDLMVERWEGAEKLPASEIAALKRPEAGAQWVEERKRRISSLLLGDEHG